MKNLILLSLISLNFVSTYNSKDYILSELKQDIKFDENSFIIDKNCALHEDFQGILLYEHSDNDLIFYLFNQAGFGLLNTDNCRILMSYNDSIYNHYSLEFLGNSNDLKFYKFKIKDFYVDYSISERTYNIVEFEIKQERVFEGDNAIGVKAIDNYYSCDISQEYTYIDNSYSMNELKTLTIDVNADYFRVPGSKNNYPNFEIVQTDIFYIYFLMPTNYGDLISIDIEWYENFEHYRGYNSSDPFYEPEDYYDSYINKYVRKIISEDDNTSLDANSFYFFNPANWFVGGSKGYDLKNLQSFALNDLDELNNKENNYCLTNNSINFIKENLANLQTVPYVIRFDAKDFCRRDYSVVGEFGVLEFYYEIKRFYMTDVDVITCTFNKNGEVYILPVVSNTNNITTGDNIVPNNEYLALIKKIIFIALIIICFILLLPIIPALINLIIFIISLPFRFIKRIIKTFKKEKKDG